MPPPPRYLCSNSWKLNYYLIWPNIGGVFAEEIKNLEMGNLSWIFQADFKCHHKCPYALCPRERQKGRFVNAEAETSQGRWQPLESGKSKGTFSPTASKAGMTLSTPWFPPSNPDFWTSGLRNCEEGDTSVVALSSWACGYLLQEPQETNSVCLNANRLHSRKQWVLFVCQSDR